MRLEELEPKWTVGDRWETSPGIFITRLEHYLQGLPPRHGMGISFLCPAHRDHRLAVFFSNPIDGMPPQADRTLWQRSGDTFATLTLAPSIDASKGREGCWHGHITQGEVIGV